MTINEFAPYPGIPLTGTRITRNSFDRNRDAIKNRKVLFDKCHRWHQEPDTY